MKCMLKKLFIKLVLIMKNLIEFGAVIKLK